MQTANMLNVFSARFEHTRGKEAWRNNLRLTAFAAERIRSSIGPNGAFKMVAYNLGPEKVVKITKDAVTVLQELSIQYPTLTVLSEAAKIQRQEVGDGVKSFIILTTEILKQADELMSKRVHPTKILRGYQEATKKALEIITAASEPLNANDLDSVLDSIDCGRGFINTKLRQLLLEAVEITKQSGTLEKDAIRFLHNPGGSHLETRLVRGLVVKKDRLHPSMPAISAKPRIALTSGRIGINRLEVKMPHEGPFNMKFNVLNPEDLEGFGEAEKKQKENSLSRLGKLNTSVLFSQQPIDDFSKSKLLEMGILSFASVDRTDLSLIAKATGGRIVGNISELEEIDIGVAEKLEMEKIGGENAAVLSCSNYATFLIRGSTLQVLDELELVINNSIRLLRVAQNSNKKVPGGGAIELHISRNLKDFALQFSGREQLAILKFADALLELPRCVAINDGVNPDDAIAKLGTLHFEGLKDNGLTADGSLGKSCVDISEVKTAAIRRAFEVASLLLRIDEQIVAKEIPKFHKQ